MTRRAHRGMGLVVSLLLMLWLVAPVVRAQDEAPPPETATEVAAPVATEPEPGAEVPAPAPPELPAAPEEPVPVATEPPATEEPPVEPPPAPPSAETPVPMAEPTAAEPATDQGAEEPADTSALVVESSLTVSVVDAATSAPITGASVAILDTNGTPVTSGTTDASGVAAIGAIAEGWYNLEVTAAGYFDAKLYSQWVSGQAELPLALQPLPPPGTLGVVVIDQQTGAPIAGAAVVVSGYWSGEEVASGTTASDGTFVTPELTGGEYNVSVSAAQYLDDSFYARLHGPIEITAHLQLAPLPGMLTIHVVDQADNMSLAGATVTVRDMSWTVVATGTTDGDGTFVTSDLAGGQHWVEVSAGAYLGSSGYVTINGAAERTFALQLAPLPGTIEVTVVDTVSGIPVAGATVRIFWPIFLSGTTDDDGVFLTPALGSGNYWVEVSATGYVGDSAFVSVDGNIQLTIDLDPILPGTLTVQALDEFTSAPIAGASVIVRDYRTGNEVASGTTDAGGVFVTSELTGGEYTVEVSAEHYTTGHAYPYVFVDGPIETSVTLRSQLPGTITVTVVDVVSGQPIAGSSVNVLDWGSTVLASGVTDASGVFVTPELRSGDTRIIITAEGYREVHAYFWLGGSRDIQIDLTPQDAGDLTVTAREQSTWSPISGATVVVRDGLTGAEVASGATDGNGVYVAAGLPGGSYTVIVSAAGYATVRSPATIDGPRWVTAEMQPQVDGILTVTAVDGSTGEPLAGASVIVTDPDGNEVAAGPTGDDGAFSTGTLEGGWYVIAVTGAGYQPAETQTFVSGDSQVSIWLQPAAGTLTISVVDKFSGEPVASATVMVSDYISVVATGTTDANGAFAAGVLDPREYYIEVSAEGYFFTVERPIVRGDTVFTVVLEPRVAGPLTVVVTDLATGKPVHKALVEIGGESGSVTGTTDSRGSLVTGTLPGDGYSVDVHAEGYADGWAWAPVSGPTEITVALEPEFPGAVTITVVDQITGEPVPGAAVEVHDLETRLIVDSGQAKKSGTYTTRKLPSGLYSIWVKADGYFLNGDMLRVSGDTAVTIGMYPGTPGVLTVTTIDQATGATIAGAEVVVTNLVDGAQVAAGATNANGVFVTGTLEAGDYRVDVAADGYFPIDGGYTFVNGDAALTLSLEPAVPGALTVTTIDQSTWQGLPGASVTIRDYWTGDIVASGVTDASGYLVTPELPPGKYIVAAGVEGYALTGNAWVRISGPAHVTLWMVPGEPGALTVYVYDGHTGTLVADATVVVRDERGTEVAAGTTDGEGTFVTGELATGTYSVDVTADRYHQTVYHYAIVNGPSPIWIGLHLRTEATLSLSVDTGTPGMKVQVDGSGYQPGEVVTIVWHDPDGMVLATTKAKSDGTIATSFTIPGTYPSWHRVVAFGQDSGTIGAANLTVVVPETP